MIKIYLAGPLFSLAEKDFNSKFSDALKKQLKKVEIILPQDRAKRYIEQEDGKHMIFKDCLNQIDESDVMVAILEGADADSGTSVELGYAYAKKKPIVGLRTDFRESEDKGLNLMISNSCSILIEGNFTGIIELAKHVAEAIEHEITKLRKD